MRRTPVRRLIVPGLGIAVLGTSMWVLPQTQLQVGYSTLAVTSGSSTPVATALFTSTNSDGVLVSQAGVAAAVPIASGRIFVDEAGTRTGLALVNPAGQAATATFTLRDLGGRQVDRKTDTLAAGQHLPRYVGQLFGSLPADFRGTLTFEGDQKLSAITLRESRNAQAEPLYTTLPVADLSAGASSAPLVFPQVAAGGGYSTQLVLLDTGAQVATGTIRFVDSSGAALALRAGGVVASQFTYRIEPNGAYRLECDRPAGLGVGYAVVTPDAGTSAPAGTAIFQFKRNGIIVTEAGVAASPATTAARIFADSAGTYTGVALASSADQTAVVSFTLLDRYGTVVDSASRTLAARGHLAVFAHELFPDSTKSFTGLIEIASPVALSAITLKQTDNARGDSILTTLPVADLTRPPAAAALVFPQIAIGEGFSTRLIFISAARTGTTAGRMSFYQSAGSPMLVPLGGTTASQFTYDVAAGGGRQFRPGETAKLASIAVLDSASGTAVLEIAVNEGKSLRPPLLLLDAAGQARDDFDPTFTSLSTDVASVDTSGAIQGKKAGFSTLTISSGGVVGTCSIAVVAVSAGVTGYQVTGVAQDLARRVFLADSVNQTILLAQDLKRIPDVYAGVSKTAGLKNDVRLQALFREPGFLALNQSDGALYVGDGANHVIRRVQPGPAGRVETAAGTGAPGSADGAAATASFNNPRGVALDGRGNLWVADAKNHTIRRLRLATGVVETVAGRAGASGWVDGRGDAARFSSPAGIAVETEPVAQQLERERKGQPPPAVSVLVADTGNGVVRRVKESGEVETIRAGAASRPGEAGGREPLGRESAGAPGAALTFVSPTGVAVDPFGNVYVTESTSGRVRAILPGGDVVSAAQPRTFSAPRGIVVTQGNRILVADGASSAQEIAYGEPRITSVTPDRFSNRGGTSVTIKGSNFAFDTIVVIGEALISGVRPVDTQTITFTAPALPSGLSTLTVQHRGGLAQTPTITASGGSRPRPA